MGWCHGAELSNPINQGGLEDPGASSALMEQPGAGSGRQPLRLQETLSWLYRLTGGPGCDFSSFQASPAAQEPTPLPMSPHAAVTAASEEVCGKLRAGHAAEPSRSTYLHVPVEADRGEEEALQVLEGDRPLLVLVDGERQGPPGQIQQHSHRGAFRYPPLGSVGGEKKTRASLRLNVPRLGVQPMDVSPSQHLLLELLAEVPPACSDTSPRARAATAAQG